MFFFVCFFASLYSVVTAALLIFYVYLKRTHGIERSTAIINRLAGSREIIAFEIFSYASGGAWFLLAFPVIDLFTLQWFTTLVDDGFQTYFGWMSFDTFGVLFALAFFNILGARGAMKFTSLSAMLRKGRVMMVPVGLFWVWMPAK